VSTCRKDARRAEAGTSGASPIVDDTLVLPEQNIFGARGGCTPGRRGTESVNSRRGGHLTGIGWVFSSPRAVLPEPPNHKEEPT
jgi:hypothetical protein